MTTAADQKLTVAIATMDNRVDTIEADRLPVLPFVRYSVTCQGNARVSEARDFLQALKQSRPDIGFEIVEGRGVTRSRNFALHSASTPYLLFADDDIEIQPMALVAIVAEFDRNPALAIVSGRTIDPEGRPLKRYTRGATVLTRFNSAKIGTVELAVRPDAIREVGVTFDERFGAGTTNYLGDEFIFVADCLKAGLSGKFIPVDIARHMGPSSGGQWNSVENARARGAAFDRAFRSPLSYAVKLAFLARHWRKLGGFGDLVRYATTLMRARVT